MTEKENMITSEPPRSLHTEHNCPACGQPLREMQISRMLGNSRYSEWCREGYCSLKCFESERGSMTNDSDLNPVCNKNGSISGNNHSVCVESVDSNQSRQRIAVKSLTYLTIDGLPQIHAVILRNAVKRSVVSLSAWGLICLCTWWFLVGHEYFRDNPCVVSFLLSYGHLFLGIGMFVFAMVGCANHSKYTILSEGLMLLLVGLITILNGLMVGMRHGKIDTGMTTLSVFVALTIMGMGVKRLSSFTRVRKWKPAHINNANAFDVENHLKIFVGSDEDADVGIIMAEKTEKFGPVMESRVQYRGLLSDSSIIMLSKGLDECFTIERKNMEKASFNEDGTVFVCANNNCIDLSFGALSTIIVKKWIGISVTASDILKLGVEKKATVYLLKPFLEMPDETVRASTVRTLAGIVETDGARDLMLKTLTDSHANVRIAAIQSFSIIKNAALQEEVICMLDDAEPKVRIEVVRYISKFPSEKGRAALSRIEMTESNKDVKKEIMRVQKKCNKG